MIPYQLKEMLSGIVCAASVSVCVTIGISAYEAPDISLDTVKWENMLGLLWMLESGMFKSTNPLMLSLFTGVLCSIIPASEVIADSINGDFPDKLRENTLDLLPKEINIEPEIL